MRSAGDWDKIASKDLDAGQEKYLRTEYILIERRHWTGLKIAAGVITIVAGVGVWQLARSAAGYVVSGAATKEATDRVAKLEEQAVKDAKTIADIRRDWEQGHFPSRVRYLEANQREDLEDLADIASCVNVVLKYGDHPTKDANAKPWKKAASGSDELLTKQVKRRDELKGRYPDIKTTPAPEKEPR